MEKTFRSLQLHTIGKEPAHIEPKSQSRVLLHAAGEWWHTLYEIYASHYVHNVHDVKNTRNTPDYHNVLTVSGPFNQLENLCMHSVAPPAIL